MYSCLTLGYTVFTGSIKIQQTLLLEFEGLGLGLGLGLKKC